MMSASRHVASAFIVDMVSVPPALAQAAPSSTRSLLPESTMPFSSKLTLSLAPSRFNVPPTYAAGDSSISSSTSKSIQATIKSDSQTSKAVVHYQSAHGITPAGYVGPATRDALNQ